MKKLLSLLLFLSLSTSAIAVETITGFDDKSVPVLNEELRNQNEVGRNNTKNVSSCQTSLTALTARVATLEAQVAAPGNIPVGGIIFFGGSTAPAGFLLCDGSAVSRITYAALYVVVGDAFGAGDGVNTFNLPDVRGRFLLGEDDMGGVSADRVTHAQADILGGYEGGEWLIPHDHSLNAGYDTWTRVTATGVAYPSGLYNHTSWVQMPPYQTVNYIIKT